MRIRLTEVDWDTWFTNVYIRRNVIVVGGFNLRRNIYREMIFLSKISATKLTLMLEWDDQQLRFHHLISTDLSLPTFNVSYIPVNSLPRFCFFPQMVQLDRTVIRQTQTSLYTWILRLWTNNPLEIRESATLHHHSFFESKQSFNPTESQNDLSNTCQLSYTLHLQSRGNWLHLIIPYTNE